MEEWKTVLIVVAVLAVIAAVVMYLLCVNSGDISREEEKNAECRMQNAE